MGCSNDDLPPMEFSDCPDDDKYRVPDINWDELRVKIFNSLKGEILKDIQSQSGTAKEIDRKELATFMYNEYKRIVPVDCFDTPEVLARELHLSKCLALMSSYTDLWD